MKHLIRRPQIYEKSFIYRPRRHIDRRTGRFSDRFVRQTEISSRRDHVSRQDRARNGLRAGDGFQSGRFGNGELFPKKLFIRCRILFCRRSPPKESSFPKSASTAASNTRTRKRASRAPECFRNISRANTTWQIRSSSATAKPTCELAENLGAKAIFIENPNTEIEARENDLRRRRTGVRFTSS